MMHRARQKGRRVGTLLLDRRFAKVLGPGPQSRVRKASGTDDPATFRLMNAMLTVFARRRPEILEDIRDGRITPMQAFRWWETGEWERIPSGRHMRPLGDTLEQWVAAADERAANGKMPKDTARGRREFRAALRDRITNDMTLSDLPRVLLDYRVDCERRDVARSFNLAKTHAQAFFRDNLRKSDPLYRDVVDIPTLPAARKIPHMPQSVAQARLIRELLGPVAGACWWSMCVTGMNPKEYFDDGWEIDRELGAVRIRGKKRRGRDRVVPLVDDPVVPQIGRAGFRTALRRRVRVAASIRVSPMDARRTHSNWMVDAGIPANRRRAYRGHGAGTMGELYEEPQLFRDVLAQDAAAMKAKLGIDVAGLRLA